MVQTYIRLTQLPSTKHIHGSGAIREWSGIALAKVAKVNLCPMGALPEPHHSDHSSGGTTRLCEHHISSRAGIGTETSLAATARALKSSRDSASIICDNMPPTIVLPSASPSLPLRHRCRCLNPRCDSLASWPRSPSPNLLNHRTRTLTFPPLRCKVAAAQSGWRQQRALLFHSNSPSTLHPPPTHGL